MTGSQPDCLQSFIELKMQHIEAAPQDFTRLGIHVGPVLSRTSPFPVCCDLKQFIVPKRSWQ